MARRKMLGEVNLLGLDSFGANPGLNPIWGAAIGGGVSGITSIALRHSSNATLMGNSEIIGLLAGLGVSGAMYAMPATRHAALGAAVGALLASGIAWLEGKLFGTAVVPAAAIPAVAAAVAAGTAVPGSAAMAGMGLPMVRGLGIPQVRGLGIPQVHGMKPAAGTAYPVPGVAGSQLAGGGLSAPPISLLGPGSPQATHLRGIGGPMTHGLSAAYGATLLGGGR